MADQAKVTSIDALESFRATLVRYLERARRSLDDVGGEVRRTRTWLDGDRRMHWDQQAKIRARKLAQAEQELYSVRLTDTHGVHALQKMMVLKARRAFDEVFGGVQPVRIKGLPVQWLSTTGPGHRTVLVSNNDGAPWTGEVVVSNVAPALEKCRELTTGAGVPFSRNGETASATVSIAPYGVAVLRWTE